jgi:5-methylcytosine-specific restriction enzyme subunit McrC
MRLLLQQQLKSCSVNNLHKKQNHITVFEHQSIRLNHLIDGVVFDAGKLHALQGYYGTKGVPYFSLIYNGIKFNEYVGVITVGDLVIEVLPKSGRALAEKDERKVWREVLIKMLCAVGIFDIHAPSSSVLKLKPNAILDLYFELFIKEVEYLLHNGLVKKYRKKEGNKTALKGNLLFAKHLRENLTHQERFYVSHTTYNFEHKLHYIIYKTLRCLQRINVNAELQSRLGALLLNFPEMPDVKVTDQTFDTIIYNRKTKSYQKSIEIARLILLQFHPDLSRGSNHVLALMFDMNKLWEQFVYVSLKKHMKNSTITAQTSKSFWKPAEGSRSKMRPDIVINAGEKNCIVLDTKWKNLNGRTPSPDDLRQMYVYHEYYGAEKVALVYPGPNSTINSGNFFHTETGEIGDKCCGVICLEVGLDFRIWQKAIHSEIDNWISLTPNK